MRLTEGIAAFQLTANPNNLNDRRQFTHLSLREAKELRLLGLKAKKQRESDQPGLFAKTPQDAPG